MSRRLQPTFGLFLLLLLLLGAPAPTPAEARGGPRWRLMWQDENFQLCVHTRDASGSLVDSRSLRDIRTWLQASHATLVDAMGFRPPLKRPGATRTIVLVTDFGDGAYEGVPGIWRGRQRVILLNARKFGRAPPGGRYRVPSPYRYNRGRPLAQTTVAHEYFHAVQYAYDGREAPWLKEATATWAGAQVFPQSLKCLRAEYRFLVHPDRSLHEMTYENRRHRGRDLSIRETKWGRPYGTSIFFRWLLRTKKGDLGPMRKLWEECASVAGDNAFAALGAVFGDEKTLGPRTRLAYEQFALARLLLDQADAAIRLPNARMFRGARRRFLGDVQDKTVPLMEEISKPKPEIPDPRHETIEVAGLGSRYLRFRLTDEIDDEVGIQVNVPSAKDEIVLWGVVKHGKNWSSTRSSWRPGKGAVLRLPDLGRRTGSVIVIANRLHASMEKQKFTATFKPIKIETYKADVKRTVADYEKKARAKKTNPKLIKFGTAMLRMALGGLRIDPDFDRTFHARALFPGDASSVEGTWDEKRGALVLVPVTRDGRRITGEDAKPGRLRRSGESLIWKTEKDELIYFRRVKPR